MFNYSDLESLPNVLQRKYALLRDLDKSLQGAVFHFEDAFVSVLPFPFFGYFLVRRLFSSLEKFCYFRARRIGLLWIRLRSGDCG